MAAVLEEEKAWFPHVCEYFEKGETCPYGENCRFAHKPQGYSCKVCWHWIMKGHCGFEKTCAYVHQPEHKGQKNYNAAQDALDGEVKKEREQEKTTSKLKAQGLAMNSDSDEGKTQAMLLKSMQEAAHRPKRQG